MINPTGIVTDDINEIIIILIFFSSSGIPKVDILGGYQSDDSGVVILQVLRIIIPEFCSRKSYCSSSGI